MACSYLNFLKIFPSFRTFSQQYYKNESIHLNSWKHRSYLLIFSLELEIYGVAIQNIHKNSKRIVAFVRNCLVRMTLRMFQSIFVVMTTYGANASEAVQRISTRTLLELCQLTKTANFIATPMKKYIQQFITGLLEIQARFLFFS